MLAITRRHAAERTGLLPTHCGAWPVPVRYRGMAQRKIYKEPSDVEAREGAVAVEGPDEVDIELTPEAAEETSERLLTSSMEARGQRRLKDHPHRPK